jgi:hypothetical protein
MDIWRASFLYKEKNMTDKKIFTELPEFESEALSGFDEPVSLGPISSFGDVPMQTFSDRSGPFTVADFEKLLTE